MKSTVFIALIATTAIALAGGSALAKNARHGAPVDFETLDTNADGQITMEEMQSQRTGRFASADTDGDGFLTQDELEAAASERAKERAGKMIERHDANADGKLSAEELERPGRGDRLFNRADADGDGAITKSEFDEAMAKMKDRRDRKGSK
ncbi:EF-hand domain-containing protein [Roseobacter sp.]|uniref:EF-hand domain-containing protein n=1 Tax=Roseobacter sp. TaxID=1907202 RepID=UPI00385F8EE6